ncbi:MAG: butyrate kinase [Alkalibacterium sp.]|uniref:Probable butyrate kinase n=1 Tax=Alkalibacterium gilvum TaxID=1130080 RepID=A0A1H6TEG4_9LACT|nr:butyrate kinase [Alkalibacterium gilvum]MDN6327117.1 butyrate kinase [Alkalibacterium sp.]MDN6734351.1 butyrate kinase [Tetragenococcus koreensis]SEI74680.1 butyrate kinase [Alkalibacterium gilvum]
MGKIIVINPGATSTKFGYFVDAQEEWTKEIKYNSDEIKKYNVLFDQFEFRLNDILSVLKEKNIEKLDAVVSRGGLVGPVKSGAYIIDQALLDKLEFDPVLEHASNLGAKIAYNVLKKYGTEKAQAYIYDPVTVDEMIDIARITGLKEVQRKSIGHHLNMRAVAIKVAEDHDTTYERSNIVVAHLGGGSTASAHRKGKIVDFVSDDEIMFSAERSGGLPLKELLPLMKETSVKDMSRRLRSEAGLQSLLGTKDLMEIEECIEAGDHYAEQVISALSLQIAKTIATLSTTLKGDVDYICLTGGMAHSDRVFNQVKSYINYVAPVKRYPGEFELIALAKGGERVINNKETANNFQS